MKILNNVGRTISNNAGKVLTKGIGLAALGLVGYDANYIGKLQADIYSSERDADMATFYLNNSLYSTNMSKFQSGIKDTAYTMELDQGWRRFFNSGIGYMKGFTSMLAEHVIPLGLGLGALLSKGKAGKICAGGIGLYAGFELIRNFFGIGTPKGLNNDIY